MANPQAQVRLDLFRPTRDYLGGRPRVLHLLWFFASAAFMMPPLPIPSRSRVALLRMFGARIGKGVKIKHGVQVYAPWNLVIGDHVWIGHGCVLLNMAGIELCSHSALAHEVYLAAAGHDIGDPTMPYKNDPVTVGSGAWLATRSMVLAGVDIPEGVVVAAGSVVHRSPSPWTVVSGVPAVQIADRQLRHAD